MSNLVRIIFNYICRRSHTQAGHTVASFLYKWEDLKLKVQELSKRCIKFGIIKGVAGAVV